MLIPIGRDDSEIRRHAWVSYAILAINIVVFIVIGMFESNATKALESKWREAVDYQVRHPYLETPKAMRDMLNADALAELAEMGRGYPVPSRDRLNEEQAHLNQLSAEVMERRDAHPHVKLAYIPARGGFLTMFTSMFVHGDIFHLLGNLLFFFISGPFVEDVFGRPLFSFLYFGGGIVAVLSFALLHGSSTAALVGASGAIAAVMGAYLVRFARSKIEFLFIPFLWRPMFNFRFWMPAFVVLPLWFIQQVLELRSETAGGGGVAFSAHVGGFVFGLAVAGVAKGMKFEDKYVDPHVLAQTTWSLDPRLLQAMEARKVGNLEGAQASLDSLMTDANCSVEALQIAMDVALEAEDTQRYDTAATRLLASYVQSKETALAEDLVREVTDNRDLRIPRFLARAAPLIERTGNREWAISLYERLYDADPVSRNAVPSLMKLGALRRLSGDMNGARDAFAKARAHPACTPEWAPSIDAKLAQLR
jgi:membrane associated rhomboid family serine protease